MQRSEQIGQLVAALAKAQAAFKPVGKDKTAKIASQKGTFSYSYADLSTVVEATRPALSANGLGVMQPVRLADGQIIVTTILAHASGEWLSEEMAWPVASTDNRSIGSGVTYARRHSYLAIVGAAATDEDDDAESARGGDHDTARPANRTESVKAKIAAKVSGTKMPPTPEARKTDLIARMTALGLTIPGDRATQLATWIGRPVDGSTVLSGDDWMKADAGLADLKDKEESLARARTIAEQPLN